MSHTAHAPLLTLRSSVHTVRSHPVPLAVSPLSLEERAAVLDAGVSRALGKGAELESHTATVAVVVYPGDKPNHVAHLLLTFLRCRLGLFTRAAAAPENVKCSRVMLTVDECGNVTRWALPR
jgi:hypothetical protein